MRTLSPGPLFFASLIVLPCLLTSPAQAADPAAVADAPAPATSSPAALVAAPTEDDEDPPRKPGEWYGYQTLLTDVAAAGMFGLAVKSGSSMFAVASVSTYVLGAPIVHFAHGHVGKGFGDLGLRLGLPVGGALVGAGLACAFGGCSGKGDFAGYAPAIGGVLGAASGGVAAMILDWALISREPAAPRAAKVRLTPSLAITPAGGSVGLGGAF